MNSFLLEADIQFIINDIIQYNSMPPMAISTDFYVEYDCIINTIVDTIFNSIKEVLLVNNKNYANKTMFLATYPKYTSEHENSILVNKISSYISTDKIEEMIKTKLRYICKGNPKYYSFSKEFTFIIKDFFITKIIDFTTTLLLISNNNFIESKDIHKFKKIMNNIKTLINDIPDFDRKEIPKAITTGEFIFKSKSNFRSPKFKSKPNFRSPKFKSPNPNFRSPKFKSKPNQNV